MPSTVSQKWLAMHLKCPSRMMDLFTAVAVWLEKDTCSVQLDIEKPRHCCLKIFPILEWFPSFKSQKKKPTELEPQLFSWRIFSNTQSFFINKKFDRGLSPAAASGNCFTLCSLECLASQIRATGEPTSRVQVHRGAMCFLSDV